MTGNFNLALALASMCFKRGRTTGTKFQHICFFSILFLWFTLYNVPPTASETWHQGDRDHKISWSLMSSQQEVEHGCWVFEAQFSSFQLYNLQRQFYSRKLSVTKWLTTQTKKQTNGQETMKNNGKFNKDAQSNFHATALSIYMQYLLQCHLNPC